MIVNDKDLTQLVFTPESGAESYYLREYFLAAATTYSLRRSKLDKKGMLLFGFICTQAALVFLHSMHCNWGEATEETHKRLISLTEPVMEKFVVLMENGEGESLLEYIEKIKEDVRRGHPWHQTV